MSERDEQPATVPPPAGEDDAYSATTKVGAMPADIMEKLRAEGLLPEDAKDRETPVNSFRPSTSLEKRSAPEPLVSTPPDSGAPVPQLYSSAPPAAAAEEAAPASKMVTAKPPPPDGAPVSEAIETPVAFAFPPSSGLPKLGEAADDEEKKDTTALTAKTLEKTGAQAPSKATMYVVAAVVVLLLIVALMRFRG